MMEIKRRSVLDVVLNGFAIAERRTYLHRLTYIGEHHLPLSGRENIISYFEKDIKLINEEYCDEKLAGLLLCYSSQFVHVLEMEVLRLVSKLLPQGSEEVLLKHGRNMIREVDKDKEEAIKSTNEKPRARKLGTMKILTVSHHINQRFLNRWSGATARPPRLLGKINPESNKEETQIHLRNCLTKMLRLAGFMHQYPTLTLNSALKQLSDRAPDFLPEHPLLEFLLGSKTLMDLQTFIDLPDRLLAETDTYQENVWPMPSDFVPYNVIENNEVESSDKDT